MRVLFLTAVLTQSVAACGSKEAPLAPRTQTWAELRTIRRGVTVRAPGESERPPYPRERLVDGEGITLGAQALAWLRRDGGATLLVHGPARLKLRKDVLDVEEGRLFVDAPAGVTTELDTPSGPVHLADVRASIDVRGDATTEAYVLGGEVRTDDGAHAGAGERLTIAGKRGASKASVAPALAWDDWTGGLATTDRSAAPSPYGVGTVGARRPGETGTPRFPLAIQKLDVRVKIEGDFALTEVDELFFNPSSDTVEGIYRFRTPDGAVLHRFGVDRDGVVMWGHVKEKQAAAAQYQQNVYAGSREDPALLEWEGPGVYRARLYPIGPGESRRVVVRYGEWLGRTGAKGERRLYVFPMAAEGSEGSLPHIEELTAKFDLAAAGAKEVRAGMAGARLGDSVVVREHDLVPRADLAVELFDDGVQTARVYRATHDIDPETLAPSDRADAERRAKTEPDYLLVPVPSQRVALPGTGKGDAKTAGGLDLAIVIDTSAATDPASLAIARSATAALLEHLGNDDRAVVWGGDDGLRPVLAGHDRLAPIDDAARRAILTSLASVDRGGATDLGAMLSQAAMQLDPSRRGAVVYIGDGAPTVGELAVRDLRDRLAKLPNPARIFALGIGDRADMGILTGVARGAFAERITDAHAAALAALRLLETAERPAWIGATVDLGTGVERVFPRELGALVGDETAFVVGRVTGAPPTSVTIAGPGGETKLAVAATSLFDDGDLRRRWAQARLAQMMDEGAGRAALVDLGVLQGIITPVTSLYVPTKNEMSAEELDELERARVSQHPQNRLAKQSAHRDDNARSAASAEQEGKEGGTGTRAKGEEGSMGRSAALKDASEFGIVGLANAPAPGAAAPAAPPAAQAPAATATAMNAGSGLALGRGGGAAPVASAAPEKKPFPPPVAQEPPHTAGLSAVTSSPPTSGAIDAKRMVQPAAKPDAPKPTSGGAAGKPPARTIELPPVQLDTSALAGDNDADPSIDGVPSGNTWGDAIADAGFAGAGLGGQGAGRGEPPAEHEKSKLVPLGKAGGGDARSHAKSARFAEAAKNSITIRIGDVPHFARACSAAAAAPLEDRAALWRERLAAARTPQGAAAIYRRALRACEATTWRDRAVLLSEMLDALPTVAQRVQLWRGLFSELGAADLLYRGILARVRTTADRRELNQALGLKAMDPGELAKLVKASKSAVDRADKLRKAFAVWPDDFNVALRLLDALEDAGDEAGARSLARTLRMRPDADAQVRTAVGELHLRLAQRAPNAAQRALDETEARRAFGEIVEFAPDDPVARRRLGDLLRAHGYFADAARQYETLARLAPDDTTVPLLLASAAEGLGKLEEAVKWTEKGGAAGSPDVDQSPAHTARAFAATYLAWGRLAALEQGKKDEATVLSARLVRILSTERATKTHGTRVTLTWSHPEFHPTLWTNALGAPMPAPEGDVSLGIAQAIVPLRDGAFVEIRLESAEVEHAARLGATAVLTAVFDEGSDAEKIVKLPVRFTADGPPTHRYAVANGAVKEVTP